MKIKCNYINSYYKGTHNLYLAPDQFIINPEEDSWLTDETSSEATANHHDADINYVSSLPLHLTVLLMNIL
jgi:hypothetical protein